MHGGAYGRSQVTSASHSHTLVSLLSHFFRHNLLALILTNGLRNFGRSRIPHTAEVSFCDKRTLLAANPGRTPVLREQSQRQLLNSVHHDTDHWKYVQPQFFMQYAEGMETSTITAIERE